MIFALLGGLVGCGAFVLFLVVLVGVLVQKRQSDVTASEIASGSTVGLQDWSGTTLAELSRNIVGTWQYYRPLGGRRVSRTTAGIHSCRTRGEVARFSAEKRGSVGEMALLTTWTRLDITFNSSACKLLTNGVGLGVLDLGSGQAFDARGVEIGAYQRGPDAGRLVLRGRDVAWVRRASAPEDVLPAVLEPICSWVAPALDEEATLWLLAIVAIEAGIFAMPSAPGPLML